MLGHIWRFFVALADWRSLLRRPFEFEVVFLTNIRDATDKKRFLGDWVPSLGHFNGPRYWFKNVSGRTRGIYSLSTDLVHKSAISVARTQCIQAIEYVQARGAKVILLAASTKRLFGRDGAELKEMFPSLLFTIGDNGTAFLLISETMRALSKAKLPVGSRVCVIGPDGFLGSIIAKRLIEQKYCVVGISNSSRNCGDLEVVNSFDDLGEVDAVIACSHSSSLRLNSENIDKIRIKSKKLLVVDVAEPNNLTESEYAKVKEVVVRQDAGNGYNPHLKYVLSWVTYRMFRLSRGVTFGCFMETLVWAKAMKDEPNNSSLRNLNLFEVNDSNMKIISELFDKYQVVAPVPKCFGKKVQSFDLDLNRLPIVINTEYSSVEEDQFILS
jgi:hypothetical protein